MCNLRGAELYVQPTIFITRPCQRSVVHSNQPSPPPQRQRRVVHQLPEKSLLISEFTECICVLLNESDTHRQQDIQKKMNARFWSQANWNRSSKLKCDFRATLQIQTIRLPEKSKPFSRLHYSWPKCWYRDLPNTSNHHHRMCLTHLYILQSRRRRNHEHPETRRIELIALRFNAPLAQIIIHSTERACLYICVDFHIYK